MASKNKGILPAVKMCQIISAENLKQVNDFMNNEDVKKDNNKKIEKVI